MIFFKKKSPTLPIKRADPNPPVIANGHSSAPIPSKPRARAAPSTVGKGAKDKDLAEWMSYLFGDQVRLERISDIPEEAIVHFMVMKMQGRICRLTGSPNDPDLLDELMRDFMELMISRNRQGRREMQATIASGIKDQQEDEPEAWLQGKLN